MSKSDDAYKTLETIRKHQQKMQHNNSCTLCMLSRQAMHENYDKWKNKRDFICSSELPCIAIGCIVEIA